MIGWNEKAMSRREKEVLLKLVVQSIPTFSIGVFMFLGSICQELKRRITTFQWSHDVESRGYVWMTWEKMAKLKGREEKGFKSFMDLTLLCQGSKDGVY